MKMTFLVKLKSQRLCIKIFAEKVTKKSLFGKNRIDHSLAIRRDYV